MIRIIDYMSKPAITEQKESSIRQAVIKMDKHNIGSLIITENKKPIGIMTERDVFRKAIAKKLDLDKTAVERIMTKGVMTVTEVATLLEVASLMKKQDMRRIVVVNMKGEVIGIVTSKDLIDLLVN